MIQVGVYTADGSKEVKETVGSLGEVKRVLFSLYSLGYTVDEIFLFDLNVGRSLTVPGVMV